MDNSAKRKGVVRFFGRGSKGRRIFVPDPENGKLRWGDFLLLAAPIMIAESDKFTFIPDFPYKETVINTIAVAFILFSLYEYYHKLCPASRWGRSSWAAGAIAITWTTLPLILYAAGINSDWDKMVGYSCWSATMWAAFLFCRYNLYRVRRRAKAEVAMIEIRMRTRRKAW